MSRKKSKRIAPAVVPDGTAPKVKGPRPITFGTTAATAPEPEPEQEKTPAKLSPAKAKAADKQEPTTPKAGG